MNIITKLQNKGIKQAKVTGSSYTDAMLDGLKDYGDLTAYRPKRKLTYLPHLVGTVAGIGGAVLGARKKGWKGALLGLLAGGSAGAMGAGYYNSGYRHDGTKPRINK